MRMESTPLDLNYQHPLTNQSPLTTRPFTMDRMSPISLSDISVNFSNIPSPMSKPYPDFVKFSNSTVIKV